VYFVIFSYINYYKRKRPNKQESKVMTLINISKQEEPGQDLFWGLYKEQKDQIQSVKTLLAFSNPSPFPSTSFSFSHQKDRKLEKY